MARIVALIDRPPSDPDWKGAFAWNTVLSLAEAQHEILALTPLEPDFVAVTHPRLTVARPAPSFALHHAAKWLKALLLFQPEVVHTFALKDPSVSLPLSIWPLVKSGLRAFPVIRTYSTMLTEADFAPFQSVKVPIDPSDLQAPLEPAAQAPGARPYVLVPAPVGRWRRPHVELLMLSEFLQDHRELDAHIVGGWGEWTVSERRAGWRLLRDVTEQVRMGDAVVWAEFLNLVRASAGLWLRSLNPGSWPARIAAHAAHGLELPTWGEVPALNQGSPANFLSRLYSQA